MISAEEIRNHAENFGVPEVQITRDHLISHLLDAISKEDFSDITFFGGTALCRTWLPDVRLSEDIDLLVADHVASSEQLPSKLSLLIRREFPSARWQDMGREHQVDTKLLIVSENIQVKIQFVQWRHRWQDEIPVTVAPVRLRYTDLPKTCQLTVPTAAGFVAMKLLAWSDRQAPRDLFDLYGLAEGGFFNEQAQQIHKAIAGVLPTAQTLGERAPRSVVASWITELDHQIGDLPGAEQCLDVVRNALQALDAE